MNNSQTHYKSWSGLKVSLEDLLCSELSHRITYFLTRYHSVHNSYGRAAIRLDGAELAVFSWCEMMLQDADLLSEWKRSGQWGSPELTADWNRGAVLTDTDFIASATAYRSTPISEALVSDDYIIRAMAALDRRVGRRTLEKLMLSPEFASLPEWLRQFYDLRMSVMQK